MQSLFFTTRFFACNQSLPKILYFFCCMQCRIFTSKNQTFPNFCCMQRFHSPTLPRKIFLDFFSIWDVFFGDSYISQKASKSENFFVAPAHMRMPPKPQKGINLDTLSSTASKPADTKE